MAKRLHHKYVERRIVVGAVALAVLTTPFFLLTAWSMGHNIEAAVIATRPSPAPEVRRMTDAERAAQQEEIALWR